MTLLPGYFTVTTPRGQVRHVVAQHYRTGATVVLCGFEPSAQVPAGGDPSKPLCRRCVRVLGFDLEGIA